MTPPRQGGSLHTTHTQTTSHTTNTHMPQTHHTPCTHITSHTHQLHRRTRKPHHHGSQLKASLGHFSSIGGSSLDSLGGVPSSSRLPPLLLPPGPPPRPESLASPLSCRRTQRPLSPPPTLPGSTQASLHPSRLLRRSFLAPSQGKSGGCNFPVCPLNIVHFLPSKLALFFPVSSVLRFTSVSFLVYSSYLSLESPPLIPSALQHPVSEVCDKEKKIDWQLRLPGSKSQHTCSPVT